MPEETCDLQLCLVLRVTTASEAQKLISVQFVSGPFPSAPYYEGRFSNGRVWVEIVAASFGVQLENLATGNAISGATGESPGKWTVNMSSVAEVFVPSALDQV